MKSLPLVTTWATFFAVAGFYAVPLQAKDECQKDPTSIACEMQGDIEDLNSHPPSFIVTKGRNMRGGFEIDVQSRDNRTVYISKAIVNRGTCVSYDTSEFIAKYMGPMASTKEAQDAILAYGGITSRRITDPLRFGETLPIIANCNPIEITLYTNYGKYTERWEW